MNIKISLTQNEQFASFCLEYVTFTVILPSEKLLLDINNYIIDKSSKNLHDEIEGNKQILLTLYVFFTWLNKCTIF